MDCRKSRNLNILNALIFFLINTSLLSNDIKELESTNSISIEIDNIKKELQKYKKEEFAYIIYENSIKYELNWRFIISIIKQESNFNEKAISPKGALGLMQIIPTTAQLFATKPFDLFDPKDNLEIGCKILHTYLNIEKWSLNQSLIGYNAGPKYAMNFQKNKKTYLPTETKEYINKILTNYRSM